MTAAREALVDSLELVEQAASTLVELAGIAWFAAGRLETAEQHCGTTTSGAELCQPGVRTGGDVLTGHVPTHTCRDGA